MPHVGNIGWQKLPFPFLAFLESRSYSALMKKLNSFFANAYQEGKNHSDFFTSCDVAFS